MIENIFVKSKNHSNTATASRWMQAKRYLLAATGLLSLLSGCAGTESMVVKGSPSDFPPIKIGVLSDSQLTTTNGRYEHKFRSKEADKFINVAIRPAALELLGGEMLDSLLHTLADEDKENVDIILYLGDGANSGCKDELDMVFQKLGAIKKPVYYVIGNHDYLGLGNQSNLFIRRQLCARDSCVDNKVETKRDVLKRIQAFNNESSKKDDKFTYKDFPVGLDSECREEKLNDESHFEAYYVGRLSYKEHPDKLDVILTDTSDYRDEKSKSDLAKFINWITVNNGLEFRGEMGRISIKKGSESQIDTLVESLNSKNTRFRIIASHYDPTHVMESADVLRGWLGYAPEELGRLLTSGSNYWLYGHTHVEQPKHKKFKISSNKGIFRGINVGSTTDYRSHAIIVETAQKGRNTRKDDDVGYRTINYYNNEKDTPICSKVFEIAENQRKAYKSVCNTTGIETTLGLDKSYREDCFDQNSVAAIKENIALLTVESGKDLNGVRKEDVVKCLTNRAAHNERQKWYHFYKQWF